MKKLLFILLFIPLSVWGATATLTLKSNLSDVDVELEGTSASGDDYSDITFFWRAESATFGTGDYPTDYSGYSVDGDAVSYVTGQVGNALRTNGWGQSVLEMTETLWPASEYRAGFWFRTNSIVTEEYYHISGSSGSSLNIKIANTDELRLFLWDGSDSIELITTSADLAADTWYFVEISFSGTTYEIFVNSTARGSVSSTRTFVQPSTFSIGVTGYAHQVFIDNLMISDDSDRDLYALRNLTVSPR